MTALGLHGNGSAPYPNLGGTVGDSRGGGRWPLAACRATQDRVKHKRPELPTSETRKRQQNIVHPKKTRGGK